MHICKLPNEDVLYLKITFSGGLKVLHNDIEVCHIGSRGGSASFKIGDNNIDVDYTTSMLWGTQKIIIKFNGKKVYENKLILGM